MRSSKMAALTKAVHISKAINNVAKLFSNLNLSQNVVCTAVSIPKIRTDLYSRPIHTTSRRDDLMEFFEPKENWGQSEIKSGRSWRADELRIKSNEDLHKLWFVLLKERNMLLTMEHAAKEEYELFPNPERKYRVEESMANLEQVVRERNKAYHLLETGETGERPAKIVYNQLGLKYYYRMAEHVIPKKANTKWHKTHKFGYNGYAVRKFLRLYREKLWNEKRKAQNRNRNHVSQLLKRFPNMDMEALEQQYPSVDIDATKQHKKSQGHWVPT